MADKIVESIVKKLYDDEDEKPNLPQRTFETTTFRTISENCLNMVSVQGVATRHYLFLNMETWRAYYAVMPESGPYLLLRELPDKEHDWTCWDLPEPTNKVGEFERVLDYLMHYVVDQASQEGKNEKSV